MNKKDNNLNKGKYIIENKEKLLHKRKTQKKIRLLLLLVIIMISTLITLCIKLPYFNIESIQIIGNNNVSTDEIYNTCKVHLGSNIFSDNFNDSKQQIMKNPYIIGVEVKKDPPNKIIVQIQERVAVFYGMENNTYYVIDNKGILLEKRSNIKDMNLVKLTGFNYDKCQVGKLIGSKDDRKISIINEITNVIDDYRKNNKNSNMTMVDVSNVLDVKVFTGGMCIKLGTTEDLDSKFNKAINIIIQLHYEGAKGYVDVSAKANPVIFIQK